MTDSEPDRGGDDDLMAVHAPLGMTLVGSSSSEIRSALTILNSVDAVEHQPERGGPDVVGRSRIPAGPSRSVPGLAAAGRTLVAVVGDRERRFRDVGRRARPRA